jgi:DNA-binding NarL/FixJ family response regulator
MEGSVRVLLVDDHTIVRQGLRRILEEKGIEVVGEAEDGRKGLEMARELEPDIVVMDISMPKLGGIEATRRIRKEVPGAKVIILTIHFDENYIFKTLDAGANAYLVKETASEDLFDAIEAVMSGESYFSPRIPPKVIKSYRKMVKSGKKVDEFSRLTNREREILQLIAEGYTSKQIGEMLFISDKTVENHRANIMGKLDIHDTAGLVRYAIRIGLVDS